MTEDELDPVIHTALTSLPEPDASLRDNHIESALQEVSVGPSRYRRVLATAAAVIVVLAGAFALGRSTAPAGPTPQVSAPASTIPKAALTTCTEQFDSNAELVHSYEVNDVDYAIVKVGDETFILEVRSCSYVTQFSATTD